MPRNGAGNRRMIPILVGAVVATAGAGLLSLALPIAAAGLAEAPGNAILQRLHRDAPGVPALQRLIRSREASIGWREKGRTATDLALARMVLGERGAAAERPRQLALAEEALAKGLGLAPMNPYGWIRLVLIRMENGRPVAEIAPLLSLALNSGPREDRLLMPMVEAGLHVWKHLDHGDRNLLADRVRRAWRNDALRTAAAAARAGRTDLLARLAGLPVGGDEREAP